MGRSFNIRLAGQQLHIESIYPEVMLACADFIVREHYTQCSECGDAASAVSVSNGTEASLPTIRITEQDIEYERMQSRLQNERDGIPVQNYSDGSLESLAVCRKAAEELLEHGILLMHGSAVAVRKESGLFGKSEAVLFLASSGTGKTTHSKLWLRNIPGSFIINGDKPLLRSVSKPFICGSPWMGKENFGCSTEAPLKAVCFLERAGQNSIERVTFKDALPSLLGSSFRPSGSLSAMQILAKLCSVDFYRLKCNMDDEAALLCYGTIFAGGNDRR